MAGSVMHVLADFIIGESVVLVNSSQLTFVVKDIDKENGLVICSIAGAPEIAGRFRPEELKKIKPSNSTGKLNYHSDDE